MISIDRGDDGLSSTNAMKIYNADSACGQMEPGSSHAAHVPHDVRVARIACIAGFLQELLQELQEHERQSRG